MFDLSSDKLDPKSLCWLIFLNDRPLCVSLGEDDSLGLSLLGWRERRGAQNWQKLDRHARKGKIIPKSLAWATNWCQKNGVLTVTPELDSLKPRQIAQVVVATLAEALARGAAETN